MSVLGLVFASVVSIAPEAASRPVTAPEAAPWTGPTETPQGVAPAAPTKREPNAAPKAKGRVVGRVLAFGERDPIGGARIIPRDGGESVTAGEDGRFEIDLGPGTHRLVIRAVGFEDLESKVTLVKNQQLEFEYRLTPKIDGKRYRTIVRQRREIALSSTTLREAEIREVPGTRGDPLRVIGSLPGVSQLAGFLPYVVVRGAAPGNTGYYMDGSRVPILFHVALGPSVIHPYFIDAVDFYPGGAPVRLGRFASGIIEARTRPARRDRVHGDVDLRLTDAGGLLEIPVNRAWIAGCKPPDRKRGKGKRHLVCKRGPGKGALTLAGRYSYTGALLSLVQSDATIRFWDYQARFDHRLNASADFTAFAFGSFDEIAPKQPDAEGNKDPWVRFVFHRIDMRVRQRLRREGSATYAIVFGLDQAGISSYRTNEWRIAPRVDLRIPINERVTLGMGLDQEIQIFRLADELSSFDDISVEDIALLLNERVVSATAGYFEVLYQKGAVEIRPGIRVDAYAQVGNSPYLPSAETVTYAVGVDPRITLRERVAPRWVLRQSAGLYHQPPSFPIPIPGIESFGFERGLQRNAQASFGYEVQLIRDRLNLVQDAYVGYLSNLQDYELGEAADEEPLDELEDIITQVTGWAYGLETMLRLDPELRVFGWAAYTLSRSTRNFHIGGHVPSNWDQRHIVNVVLGYRISDRWNVGGRVHYHTGRPWTAPYEDQSMIEALGANRNNARLPAFFQLDLRIERNWRFPNWQLDMFLDIANATYSREIFQCTAGEGLGGGEVARSMVQTMALAAAADPSKGVAGCTPQGFRYIVPSFGLRGRF